MKDLLNFWGKWGTTSFFLHSPICRAEVLYQHATFKVRGATPRNLRGFVDLTEVNKLYLSWAKLINQLDYTVHAVHNVLYNWTAGNQFGLSWRVYTEYTLYKLLETSSAILCTHTVQLICSLTRENRSSFSSQAGPESRRTWERTVYRPSYNAVGEALKPSVQSIPLHRVSRFWWA